MIVRVIIYTSTWGGEHLPIEDAHMATTTLSFDDWLAKHNKERKEEGVFMLDNADDFYCIEIDTNKIEEDL
tara:strand:- start:44 stop:256 length:213 start_codon:yes stop_codon:yes gene_type:complete